ncbi:uncharacterized protein TNCV_2573961 [Trichonephila clavipes]|nr:uncharacterized protein TNCV_2573961 [Trichonephila clavipes]
MAGTLPRLLDSVVGGGTPERRCLRARTYGSNAAAVPGPKLPTTIKAGYLNCKIRLYIPNPLRCFKCQRFGHSQTSCCGQLTCSRCASTDENITKEKCPPLNLLQPLPQTDTSISTPVISTLSSTQAHLLPATSSTAATVSDPQPPTPSLINALFTTNNMFTPLKLSPTMSASSSNSSNQNPSDSTITQNSKEKKLGIEKGKRNCLKQ